MQRQRRQLLKGAGAASALGVAVAAGLLKPAAAWAAPQSQAAFEARDVANVLEAIGASDAVPSAQITIKAPDIAENGAIVPVEVTSAIPGTESIAILAEHNDLPLVAYFELMNGAEGFVSTRIKLAGTSDVRAVVKAGGKVYTAAKAVQVAAGGCGG